MTAKPEVERAAAALREALDAAGLTYERKGAGGYFVTLPGVRKLQTNCWLIVREHSFAIEAFVCRHPDEEHERVYRFLLRRNARLYGVHYTIDDAGDIYLVGRFGLETVSERELDKLLGQVLEAADGDFNTLLELGFASSIRREWDWRVSRGESLANLEAFRHLIEPSAAHEPGSLTSD
ncbi:histidine kinase [Prauserella marina]|uniref:Putative sensory transduction regulator n=1 Tax=Prauserella marina TaxID=530584 RepID=A0A222VJ41_9PSEU|nr:YbjN domain-containing protein [Prauserella marina]ASR33949.1 histidine kinase [Prauserella marina]PWV82552.1 putative sensory transduction regulator [Prauserella marina]SDC71831.1 Putative sensory transduction regulator [Prauserella marina]